MLCAALDAYRSVTVKHASGKKQRVLMTVFGKGGVQGFMAYCFMTLDMWACSKANYGTPVNTWYQTKNRAVQKSRPNAVGKTTLSRWRDAFSNEWEDHGLKQGKKEPIARRATKRQRSPQATPIPPLPLQAEDTGDEGSGSSRTVSPSQGPCDMQQGQGRMVYVQADKNRHKPRKQSAVDRDIRHAMELVGMNRTSLNQHAGPAHHGGLRQADVDAATHGLPLPCLPPISSLPLGSRAEYSSNDGAFNPTVRSAMPPVFPSQTMDAAGIMLRRMQIGDTAAPPLPDRRADSRRGQVRSSEVFGDIPESDSDMAEPAAQRQQTDPVLAQGTDDYVHDGIVYYDMSGQGNPANIHTSSSSSGFSS